MPVEMIPAVAADTVLGSGYSFVERRAVAYVAPRHDIVAADILEPVHAQSMLESFSLADAVVENRIHLMVMVIVKLVAASP